jgi:hypothetical protein
LRFLLLLTSTVSDAGVGKLPLIFCRNWWEKQYADSSSPAHSGTLEHCFHFFTFRCLKSFQTHNAGHGFSHMFAQTISRWHKLVHTYTSKQPFPCLLQCDHRSATALRGLGKSRLLVYKPRSFFRTTVSAKTTVAESRVLLKRASTQSFVSIVPRFSPFTNQSQQPGIQALLKD